MRNRNRVDVQELIKMLKMNQLELKFYMFQQLKKYGYSPVYMNGFVFAEGTIPVGLVAHMDTVFEAPKYIDYVNGTLSSKTGLGADDRAGCYGILHIIKRGLRPTIILLEDEEIGCVGADKFVKANPLMEVNYLIELDRQGSDDAVFYDCDNPEFTSYVESFGFKEAFGSFSDISEIAPHYCIAAVNLSVGYYLQHTVKETLFIGELKKTLKRVEKMLREDSNTKFEYIEAEFSFKKYLSSKYLGTYTYDYAYSGDYKPTKTSTKTISGNGYGDFPREWDDDDFVYDKTYRVLHDCIVVYDDGIMLEVDMASDTFYIDQDGCLYDWQFDKIEGHAVNYEFQPVDFRDFYDNM